VDGRHSPRAPGRGRPRKLDAEQIADAVIRRGFAGVAVEDVAVALGVGPATLYRYVGSRRELLAMGWDLLLTRTPWPTDDEPWDELLLAYATTLWRLSAQYPGAISELASGPVSPALMRLYDDLAAALVRQRFSADDAVLAADSVIDLVIDHRLGVERLDALASDELTLRAELAATWSEPRSDEHLDARTLVRAAMVRAIEDDPRHWFERKLGLVIAGIRNQLAPAR
jgi:AcrR family transcriptional regulator